MTQLAFALALDLSAAPTPTPAATGRAVRSPDRRPVPRPQPQIEEQPSIAEDFTADLTPAELRRVHAYADRRAREALEQAQIAGGDLAAQRRQLRMVAAADLLAGAKIAALSERVSVEPELAEEEGEEQGEAEEPKAAPEKPTRAPGRPPTRRDPRSPAISMPPQALRARAVVESEAPVPAGPRRPVPSAEAVLANRPTKPPARRAQGGEHS